MQKVAFGGQSMRRYTNRPGELYAAPWPELPRLMYLLFQGLIMIRNVGLSGNAEGMTFCRHLAEALHALPEGLQQYSSFDEESFWTHVGDQRARIAPSDVPTWDALFLDAQRLPPESLLSWQIR